MNRSALEGNPNYNTDYCVIFNQSDVDCAVRHSQGTVLTVIIRGRDPSGPLGLGPPPQYSLDVVGLTF